MTGSKADERVRALAANVNALIAASAGGARLHRATASNDDWDPIRVLAHVAEFLPYWAAQAHDVAGRPANNEPFGRGLTDPSRNAGIEDHAHDALAPTVVRLRTALEGASALLRTIPDGAWQKTGLHPRRGEMTIEQIVDQLICDHLVEHVSQAGALLA